MIGYEEALDKVLRAARPLGTECVDLENASGRALAEAVSAPFDLPRFDQSAVDGFAVRSDDLVGASAGRPMSLSLTGEIPAGRVQEEIVLPQGHAVRVFTGSKLPKGCDAIIMQEDVEAQDEHARFSCPTSIGSHIRRKGEEVREGSGVLAPGAKIGPAEISLLATIGLARVQSFSKPRVAILATGSELRPPGEDLAEGEIYASNGVALASAVTACGAIVSNAKTLNDDSAAITSAVAEMISDCDVLITVGGISVGAHDHIRGAFQQAGVTEEFWRVAIKPGKPVFFGRHPSGCLVFGLPGNPVSALVTFRLFVKPALLLIQGFSPLSTLQARLTRPVSKKVGLSEFTRGKLCQQGVELHVEPTAHQGSHMLSGLAAADCLIQLPAGSTEFEAGAI